MNGMRCKHNAPAAIIVLPATRWLQYVRNGQTLIANDNNQAIWNRQTKMIQLKCMIYIVPSISSMIFFHGVVVWTTYRVFNIYCFFHQTDGARTFCALYNVCSCRCLLRNTARLKPPLRFSIDRQYTKLAFQYDMHFTGVISTKFFFFQQFLLHGPRCRTAMGWARIGIIEWCA